MVRLHIIASGEAGSGKDTVADYLVDQYGYRKIAFADALKAEVVQSYHSVGLSRQDLDDRTKKNVPADRLRLGNCEDADFVSIAMDALRAEDTQYCAKAGTAFSRETQLCLPRSARRIMQIHGTEYRRESRFGYDAYWLDQVAHKLRDFPEQEWVISDGRFSNELTWAHDQRVKRFHLSSPQADQGVPKHGSEQIPPPDDQTAVVFNDKTLGFGPLWCAVDQEIRALHVAHRPRHALAA